MSAQTATLRGAVKAADDDLGDWFKGLVTGEGSSPSQIIVSGILSVVPGLGQAMDLRDIVLGVITISKSPANPLAWLDIAITLIGCIPIVGDALKTAFRMLKSGHSLSRILDAASPAMRGNLDKWFRNVNWGEVSASVRKSFDDVMGAFIDGLDSWVVKTVMGRREVALLIEQLKDLRQRAPQMLDEAIGELRALWNKALGDGVPKSTAATNAPHAPVATLPASPSPTTAKPKPTERQPDPVERDRTATTTATPDAPRNDSRRASRKKQDWSTGVPAEHIADYWCARNKRNLKKANNLGKLWEEWDKAGRHGIDHVWVQAGNSARPGVIGETKGSLFGAFRFLAALPKEIQDQLQALGEGEVENPTDNGQPNIFESDGRDGVDPGRVRVEGTQGTEDELKKGVGNTESKGVQMSHRWIARSIESERLTPAGQLLARQLRSAEKRMAATMDASWPYSRWIIMVTGRQKHLHEAKQGHKHEIQPPLVTLPDNVLEK
jgi:hypothetical protein